MLTTERFHKASHWKPPHNLWSIHREPLPRYMSRQEIELDKYIKNISNYMWTKSACISVVGVCILTNLFYTQITLFRVCSYACGFEWQHTQGCFDLIPSYWTHSDKLTSWYFAGIMIIMFAILVWVVSMQNSCYLYKKVKLSLMGMPLVLIRTNNINVLMKALN